ncbi:MAG: GNAT family N-acetyltransferase [Phycisphaerae bacterium]|nr:GNAT family N-acetyltransferase [Phycisphaerae bacterium]
MSSSPIDPPALLPATPTHAALIASWISSPEEALWTAPQTQPPITANSVASWIASAGRPRVLLARDPNTAAHDRIVAYGEVNPFEFQPQHFWIGHVIVAPHARGRGFGRQIAEGLRHIAFNELAATKLTLVVFSANEPARRAYAAAGFAFEGYETHLLKPYDRREVLVRMVAYS